MHSPLPLQSAQPGPILDRLPVVQTVKATAIFAGEPIANETVICRIETGRYRIMIRKRKCGKNRNKGISTYAIFGDPVHSRRLVQILIVPAKAVDGYQYQVRLVSLCRSIDATCAVAVRDCRYTANRQEPERQRDEPCSQPQFITPNAETTGGPFGR